MKRWIWILWIMILTILPAQAEQTVSEAVFRENKILCTGSGLAGTGSTLWITQPGVYRITGESSHGTVLVDVGKKNEVTLILKDLSLTNPKGAALTVEKAGKVTIELAAGTGSTLTAGEKLLPFAEADDESSRAAIHASCDITLTGEGALTVNGLWGDGIRSKGHILLDCGSLTVNAAGTGIQAKDGIRVGSGQTDVAAGKTGFSVTGKLKKDKGVLSVEGGQVTVSAGNNGFKSNGQICITAGNVMVTRSVEGIEARYVRISGGDISVTAEDDGVNASGKDHDDHDALIEISGGHLYVDADGDGLDSNGAIRFSGGVTVVDGPDFSRNTALDSDLELTVSGGIVLALSNNSMPHTFDISSAQPFATWQQGIQPGQVITFTAAHGEVLFTHTATKHAELVIFSHPALTDSVDFSIR